MSTTGNNNGSKGGCYRYDQDVWRSVILPADSQGGTRIIFQGWLYSYSSDLTQVTGSTRPLYAQWFNGLNPTGLLDTIEPNVANTDDFSAVSGIEDGTHIATDVVYKGTNGNITYAHRSPFASGWTWEKNVFNGTGVATPVVATDYSTGNVYVFGSTNPVGIDGSANASCANSTTQCQASLTTSKSYDLIIVDTYETLDLLPSCTFSVRDTAGLTWTLRASAAGRYDSSIPGYRDQLAEFWAKTPSTLSSDAITESISGCASGNGGEYNGLTAYGISGVNFTNPFDPNTSGLASGSGYSSPSLMLSTSNANDLIIGGAQLGGGGLAAGSGFSISASTYGAGAADEYETVNSLLTNFAVSFGGSTCCYWEEIADAVQTVQSSIVMKTRSLGDHLVDHSTLYPVTGRNSPTLLESVFASASASNATSISLIWSEPTSSSSYNVMFASIPVQTVWSSYGLSRDPWDGSGVTPYGQYFQNLGESVSPSTGMLTIKQTDLSLAGRGLDLQISRVYTPPYSFLSGNPYSTETYPWAPMGNGWQLNFPWMANTNNPAYVHLTNGEGYRIPYTFWQTSTSSFENHVGEHFRIVKYADNSANLYDKSGGIYGFDIYHRLTEIADPIGNYIYFTYNSPGFNSNINSIIDTVGRTFVFCYNAGGLLHSINQTTSGSCANGSSSVRGVVFNYSGQDLVSAIDPAGRITAYSYNTNPWILSRITYPTGWYDTYTFIPFTLGTQATTYRVASQQLMTASASIVRQFTYSYTQGPGDQVVGSVVGSYNGTQIRSFTTYTFSFAGVSWNITDGSHNFLRGYQQKFGVHGEVPQETVLVSPTQGFINYHRYDLWGNQIYSRQLINSTANLYHESFSSFYNAGVPLGFNAFQETFSQGNFTAPDNPWFVYNGTWLFGKGVYNGTSSIFTPIHQEPMFSWTNFTSPNLSMLASIYVTKAIASSDKRVGILAHYPGSGTRKWALVFHDNGAGVYLSLLDELVAWKVENPCMINNPSLIYNTWWRFNLTISGSQAWGSASSPGVTTCNVSGTFTSTDITSATGFGLYTGGYSSLFDNVTVTTVGASITTTTFSNSFMNNGAPAPSIHGAVAGAAELQNGPNSQPQETYYSYYSWGALNQTKYRYNKPGAATTLWLSSTKTYDRFGNPGNFTDSRGNVTRYVYSPTTSAYSAAYPTSVTYTLRPGTAQITTSNTYNFNQGTLNSTTDGNGLTSRYQYDILGRIKRTIYPNGDYVNYTYNDAANFVDTTNENLMKTRQIYDGIGRLSITERFTGGRTGGIPYSNETYTYNWQDQIINHIDPIGRLYNYTYDPLGRIAQTKKPDGTITQTAYNDIQSFVLSIDENGIDRCSIYDRLGRLVRVVENSTSTCNPSLGGSTYVTTYYYDGVGNLVQLTNAAGKATVYSYDSLNRLVTTTYADGTSTAYSYDNNGNLVGTTNRAGVRILSSFDALNRVTTTTYCGSPTTITSTSYTYDKAGNPLQVQNQNSTISYTYDARNRVLNETYAVNQLTRQVVDLGCFGSGGTTTTRGGGAKTYSFISTYAGEFLSSIKYPTTNPAKPNIAVSYAYDNMGRILNVSSPYVVFARFSYYRNDEIKGIQYGNGLTMNYTYDPVSRISLEELNNTSIHTTLLRLGYAYNLTGTVAAITGQVNQVSVNEQYRYDRLQRLVNSNVLNQGNDLVTSYTFDNVGNRLSQTVNGTVTNYAYNYTNNELVSAGSTTYSYDKSGNLLSKTIGSTKWNYAWNPANRLLNVSNGTPQGIYAYDGQGRLVESIENGSPTNFFAYLGTATLWKNGTDYIYAGSQLVAFTSDNLSYQTPRYYHTDALGSVRLMTKDDATVWYTHGYQPYGQDNGSTSCPTCPTNPQLRFEGKPFSQTTGLYYDYQRWYDPSIGRFLSQDEDAGDVSNPQSLNRYIYALDNPLRYVDSDGAKPVDLLVAFGSYFRTVYSWSLKMYRVRNVDLRRGDISYWKSDVYWQPRIRDPVRGIPHTLAERVKWVPGPTREKGIPLVKLDRPDAVTNFYHVTGEAVENNHFDFPPGVAVEAIYKYGKNINRGLLVVGLVLSAIDVGTAVQQDVAEGSGWSHTTRALLTEGFSWAGAIGGAELGFEIGCFAGPIGCIVGAFAGGVIGGYGGEWVANQIYDSPGSSWTYRDIGNHRG